MSGPDPKIQRAAQAEKELRRAEAEGEPTAGAQREYDKAMDDLLED